MSYNNIASVSPYFDDFDASKSFHALLYNPSKGVQARELTQMQTVLQNQIASMSNHLFKDNSIVVNAQIEHSSTKNVIQVVNDAASATLQTSYVGKIITSGPTQAEVTHVDQTNFLVYFNYTSGPGFDDSSAIELQGPLGTDTDKLTIVANTLSKATVAYCQSGIVYTGGYFVVTTPQEIIVDSTTNGHYHIGFTRAESIVSINEDVSLGDPANGTNNKSAPGADRYKIDLQLTSYIDGDAIPTDFIEFMVVNDDVITKATTKVQYADILDLLARRTYDESGNYVVDDFEIILEAHQTDSTKLEANLQPGKAYVLGYEVEKDLTTSLEIDKSRDTRVSTNNGVYADWGQYLTIAQIDSATATDIGFDITLAGTAQLPNFSHAIDLDVRDAIDGTGNIIGTIKSAGLKRIGNELRLYVTDVDDVVGSIGASKSISIDDPSTNGLYANLSRPKGYTELKGKSTGPILELEDYAAVKSISDMSYTYSKTYTGLTVSANTLTIAGSATDSFGGDSDVICIIKRATGLAIYNGLSAVPSGSSLAITRTSTDLDNGDIYDVVLSVTKTQLAVRSKSLVSNHEDTTLVSIAKTAAATDVFSLEKEDIIKIEKIYQKDNFAGTGINDTSIYDDSKVTVYNSVNVYDVTDTFFENGEFFDGQSDLYYGTGSLKGMTTAGMLALVGASANTGYYVIYDYYEHLDTPAGKAFTAASYPDFGIIGNYQSQAGAKTINLTNSIDFRSKLSEIATQAPEYPYQGSQFIGDVTYYLSRIDKIYLNSQGQFGVRKGISSTDAVAPNDVNNAITLYTVNLPAYTYDRNKVFIKKIDHKRYTMRDIGDLEARISSVEEYASLSLLEKSASDLSIVDANGFEMFKSGIFADAMNTVENHNINDPEYNLVIDTSKGIGRGPLDVDFVEFTTTGASASTNINIAQNTATLSYTENSEPLAQNTAVTDYINVNPLLFHQWNGTATLTPSVDQWIDVEQKPTVITDRSVSSDVTSSRLIDEGWTGQTGWWTNQWFGQPRSTDTPNITRGVSSTSINRSFLAADSAARR